MDLRREVRGILFQPHRGGVPAVPAVLSQGTARRDEDSVCRYRGDRLYRRGHRVWKVLGSLGEEERVGAQGGSRPRRGGSPGPRPLVISFSPERPPAVMADDDTASGARSIEDILARDYTVK